MKKVGLDFRNFIFINTRVRKRNQNVVAFGFGKVQLPMVYHHSEV